MLEPQEIGSLGREDPLEEEMATHFSGLAWEIPRTEEPGGLQSMGLQRIGHDWATKNKHPHLRWENWGTKDEETCSRAAVNEWQNWS